MSAWQTLTPGYTRGEIRCIGGVRSSVDWSYPPCVPFPGGDNSKIVKGLWQLTFNNLLLQNPFANINQTWQKASFGRGNQTSFIWKTMPFSKLGELWNSYKTLTFLENILLQNCWDKSNQTWHKTSKSKGIQICLNYGQCSFPKGG